MQIEQSVINIREIHNFSSWLTGAIFDKLESAKPGEPPEQILTRMQMSLATAHAHLATEAAALKAWAVAKRREELFKFFPKRFSEDDKKALQSSPVYSDELFDSVLLNRLDEEAKKRASQVVIELAAFPQGPSTSGMQ